MKNEGTVVADGMVVAIHYTLTDDAGSEIDTSRGGRPFEYLHGAGNIVPGLERQLAGCAPGQSLKVAVPPAEGYGEHDPRGVARVPREAFPDDVEVTAGMQFSGEDEQGHEHVIWIRAVEGETIVVDRNHPLAGVTLHFDVTIEGLRDATQEEKAHGHVHGPGGHHHH